MKGRKLKLHLCPHCKEVMSNFICGGKYPYYACTNISCPGIVKILVDEQANEISDIFIKAFYKKLYEAWIKTIPEQWLKGWVKPGSEGIPLTSAQMEKEPFFPIVEEKE